MRTDHNIVKVHYAPVTGKPLCGIQAALYQPHQKSDQWSQVTCQRCVQQLVIAGRKTNRREYDRL